MPRSTPPKPRRKRSQSLAAASLLSLAACASTSGSKVEGFCPAPVWPTKAAIDWMEQTETPPAFEDWLDKVTRQQEVLDKACR